MKFTLTDIEYDKVIKLYGDSAKERVVIKDPEFKPYFYVKGLKEKDIKSLSEHEVVSVEESDKGLKVVVAKPKDISVISESLKSKGGEVLESDIPTTKRYLLDKGLIMLEGVEDLKHCEREWEPRVLALDIETTNEKGVPDTEIDEVLMISLWSNYGTKKVMLTKECKIKNTESFPDEKSMLKALSNLIINDEPSIIVTYNGDEFDWPFLRDRMNKYRVTMKYGYDNSRMTVINRKNSSTARIKGLSHIDLYQFIKRILSSQLKTSKLDLSSVSSELINNTKNEMDWNEFYDEWAKGKLDKIVDYSLQDAKVTYELFEELKTIIYELSKIVNKPLYETSRSSYSSLVENYLINKAHAQGRLIPSRPHREEISERYKETFVGGYVHQPNPGIYENIAVVDFRSLYPTIMASYNIGPGTIGKGKEIGGHQFDQKSKGFIPSIVEELVNTRAEIKKELRQKKNPILEARSYAIKTITNATYGYLSYPRSRWYCHECSESITHMGRKHIKEVISKAEENGFGVCYGDTDSAFLLLKDKSKKDLQDFLKKVNKELPGIMELELEYYCPRGLFISDESGKGVKKRYALIDEQGKLIIKGFEFVRGDWSEISKETQYKVFNVLLKEKDEAKAIKVVKDIIEDLKENKIPLNKLVIRKQLTRDLDKYKSIGPHVAVAKRLKEKGHPISGGSMIEYVVTEGKGLIREKAHTIKEIKKQELKPDADYYINNQVIPSIERVLTALNVSKGELEGREQKGLKDYF